MITICYYDAHEYRGPRLLLNHGSSLPVDTGPLSDGCATNVTFVAMTYRPCSQSVTFRALLMVMEESTTGKKEGNEENWTKGSAGDHPEYPTDILDDLFSTTTAPTAEQVSLAIES